MEAQSMPDYNVPSWFDGCLNYAVDVYARRCASDENPTIVAVRKPNGKMACHLYYRSDDVISTSFWFWENEDGSRDFMDFYEGPVSELPEGMKKHFSEERYEVDDDETEYAARVATSRRMLARDQK